MISIVDDDESVREATKGLLRSLGYGAVAFASAEEFLQSNQLIDTECVISDVQMHGLSGVELQSQLIADGNQMPIIFITASQEENSRERADGRRNWRPQQAVQRGTLDRISQYSSGSSQNLSRDDGCRGGSSSR